MDIAAEVGCPPDTLSKVRPRMRSWSSSTSEAALDSHRMSERADRPASGLKRAAMHHVSDGDAWRSGEQFPLGQVTQESWNVTIIRWSLATGNRLPGRHHGVSLVKLITPSEECLSDPLQDKIPHTT